MSFTTYIPCDELKSYIIQFAISEATAGSSYKVLPGTGLVIGFQYQGRLSDIKHASALSQIPEHMYR